MDASKQTISPLRQRMVEDMRMRKFGEKTQLDYVRAVRNFTKYLGRSPVSATVEDLRNYQLHLVDNGVSPASLNSAISGLKFFFNVKRPFAGPEAVLAYLSRYTHRVAISNRRLVAMNEHGVSFRWKDYRAKGRTRHKTMTLAAEEFMRRFLLDVLPRGFHRIRHYGLLANAERRRQLARVRTLLDVPTPELLTDKTAAAAVPTFVCRCCGAAMHVVEIVMRWQPIRAPP